MNIKSTTLLLGIIFSVFTHIVSSIEPDIEQGRVQGIIHNMSVQCRPGKRCIYSLLNATKCGLNIALISSLSILHQSSIRDANAENDAINDVLNVARIAALIDCGISMAQALGQASSLCMSSESLVSEWIQIFGSSCSFFPYILKIIAVSSVEAGFNESARGEASFFRARGLALLTDLPDFAAAFNAIKNRWMLS